MSFEDIRIILSGQHRNKYCLKKVQLLTETALKYSQIVSDGTSSFIICLCCRSQRLQGHFSGNFVECSEHLISRETLSDFLKAL